jgi:pimeloyl-ACP methyl ester carboxylesterase
VLEGLGISQAILVAHSVGARPAMEAALQDPAKIERLVLVDPALGFHPDPQGEPRFEQSDPAWIVRAFFAAKPLRNAALGAYGTNPAATRRLFASFVSRKEAVTDDLVAMLQQALAVRNTTSAYGDWLEYLVAAQDTSLSSEFRNFRKLEMPVAIIWGSTDTVTPLWQGQKLQELIPGSEHSVIEGAGHIPYLEVPAQFNRALLTLIEPRGEQGCAGT